MSVIATEGMQRDNYHIIFTDSGHKIIDLQKRISELPDASPDKKSVAEFFIEESEILLDPDTKYEEITELTPEMENLKQKSIDSFKDFHSDYHYSTKYSNPQFWRATRS